MLQDHALKFYRDQAYVIPQKLFENGQYINKNYLFAAILKIWKFLLHRQKPYVQDNALKVDRDPAYIIRVYYGITSFENFDFEIT